MHRIRNLNNTINPFCQNITNFSVNKNIHCTSHLFKDCDKSYVSAECCKVSSDSSSESSFSDSSSCSSEEKTKTHSNSSSSEEKTRKTKKSRKNKKCIISTDSESCLSSESSVNFSLKSDHNSNLKSSNNSSLKSSNNSSLKSSNNSSFKSTNNSSLKSSNNSNSKSSQKSNLKSKLAEIKYKPKCEQESLSCEKVCESEQSEKVPSCPSVSKSISNCKSVSKFSSNSSCPTKNPHKVNKYLKLTDVFSRCTAGNTTSASISKHGKYVFLVYNITMDCSGNVVGEIFENKYGHLITKKILRTDNDFGIINGGYASSNFTKFTILDSNNTDTARVRIFDSKFNVLATKLLEDYYPKGNSFRGGKFILDGKYIALTYVYASDVNTDKQRSIIRILRSDTLEDAFEYTFEGNTYSDVQSFRTSNGCEYLILLSNDGIYNNDNPEANNFSVLKILWMDECNCKIKLVDQALLPQLGNYDFVEKDDQVYIAVGTYRADIKKVKTIFTIKSQSLLLNDGDELKVFKFSDNKLHLSYSKNLDTSAQVFFHPNKKNILIHQNNVKTTGMPYECDSESMTVGNELVQYPGFFNINNICLDNCNVTMGNSVITRTAPNNFSAKFSDNGKWLIVTGSKENSKQDDTYGIKNIQLFKVDLVC